jgi:hypothetical protein
MMDDAMIKAFLARHPHLRHIYAHLDIVLGTVVMLHGVKLLANPVVRLLWPAWHQTHLQRDPKFSNKWSDHLASQLHAILASALALHSLFACSVEDGCFPQDRLFGYTPTLGRSIAVTLGYFVWDLLLILSDLRYYGVAFLVHACVGVSALTVALSPVLLAYAPVFVLYELSTIFLNGHWILEKLGAPGWVRLLNDGLLVAMFFLVRLVFGNLQTMSLIGDLYWHRDSMPKFSLVLLPLALFAINVLNNFWFVKIVISVRKAVKKPRPSLSPKKSPIIGYE